MSCLGQPVSLVLTPYSCCSQSPTLCILELYCACTMPLACINGVVSSSRSVLGRPLVLNLTFAHQKQTKTHTSLHNWPGIQHQWSHIIQKHPNTQTSSYTDFNPSQNLRGFSVITLKTHVFFVGFLFWL